MSVPVEDKTPSEVQTRAASEADTPFLEQVFLCALKDAITAARGGWDEERERRQFHEQLEIESTRLIGHRGRDVGFMMVLDWEDHSTLHTLCILPEWQGLGLGTRVTRDLIRATTQAGRKLDLYVLKANPRARAFYERLGFRVIADTGNHHRFQFMGSGRTADVE